MSDPDVFETHLQPHDLNPQPQHPSAATALPPTLNPTAPPQLPRDHRDLGAPLLHAHVRVHGTTPYTLHPTPCACTVPLSLTHTHTLSHTLSHSLTLSLSHSHILSLSHSPSPFHSLAQRWQRLTRYRSLSLTHTHSLAHSLTLSLSHSLTHTISHSLTLPHPFTLSFNGGKG